MNKFTVFTKRFNFNYIPIRNQSRANVTRSNIRHRFRKNKNVLEANYINISNITEINNSDETKKSTNSSNTTNSPNTANTSNKYSGLTNAEFIDSNYGVKEFVKKTYLWTGGGICGSIGLSMLGALIMSSDPHFLTESAGVLFGTGAVLSIGGAIGIGFTKYSVHKDIVNISQNNQLRQHGQNGLHKQFGQLGQNAKKQVEILYSTNSIPRTLSYVSLIVGNGIVMTPMFFAIPNAVLPAFIASSSVFGGATYYAMTRKTGELETWGSALYGGLTGMVGISLLGLGSNLIFGHNWFGDLSHVISLYGGIPLFTGLVAYDTHKSIDKYQSGDPDHLGCSTELYLDFINLFVRFMEIVAKIQNANKND